jgi:dTDP-4-dehydrorhamnose 3,5-epimerase
MQAHETSLPDALVLAPAVHGDARGFFQETWRRDQFAALGITDDFVQDNHSRSTRGVVRGMHLQVGDGVAKLVRCVRGEIFDVLIDVRRGSPAFGRWEAFTLNDRDHHMVYVPVGFAHGFCVLSEVADVAYKQTAYYDPGLERGVAYDDPDLAIAWPADLELIVSDRDRSAPLLREIAAELPFSYAQR